MRRWRAFLLSVTFVTMLNGMGDDGEPTRDEIRQAILRATRFFHGHVAVHGGYVWRYSADLTFREGEGIADTETVWVQPPGTPTVGMAFLNAYERTRLPELLEAAKDAGRCLAQGQLRSGGWHYSIRFNPEARLRFAYRLDPPREGAFNVSTLDDDTTQAAVRFLLRLDRVLRGRDRTIKEATDAALEALLKAQYPNGAFPQQFATPPDPARHPDLPATLPTAWPRTWPNKPYGQFYTLNDDVPGNTIVTLIEAFRIRTDPRFYRAAIRAGEFLLKAQLPEPQPGWAQQYDFDMKPAWARRFEPPAVSAGETQQVLKTLLMLAEETGDRRFLEPVPRAIAYLRRSLLSDGRLARFYELGSNRPLYFTRQYELTYDDSDMPTHYAFKVPAALDALERRYEHVRQALEAKSKHKPRRGDTDETPSRAAVHEVLRSMDARGSWVEEGTLRYHPARTEVDRIISSETFVRNLDVLARAIRTAGTARRSSPRGAQAWRCCRL